MFVLESPIFLVVVLTVSAESGNTSSPDFRWNRIDLDNPVNSQVMPIGGQVESDNITFKDVRVIGYELGDSINSKVVPIRYATNLKEIPQFLNFETIDDIRGPLQTLYENSVTDLPNLRIFRKTFESLEHIEPRAFKNLTNLETLIIFTKLSEVREGVFNHLKIRTLYLHGNDISEIEPRAFDNMTELQVLSMYSNKLTLWDKNWFYNTSKLPHLYFSNNKFEELPKGAFENLKSGKGVLSFRFCGVKRLGKNLFGGNKNVGVLDLSYNKIKVFGDDVLDGVEEIEKLVLSNNNIWCFSGVLDRVFVANLTEVYNNPIVCDGGCLKRLTEWESEETNALKVRKIDYKCV